MTEDVIFSKEFSEVLEKKMASLKNRRTASDYRHVVESICRESGKDFLILCREDVERYFMLPQIARRKESSRAAWMRILRSVAKFTDAELGTSTLQAFLIDWQEPPADIEIDDLPVPESVDRVLSLLRSENDRQMFLVITLVLETGLSTGELCRLNIGNFALDVKGHPMIRIEPECEDGLYRNIPLSTETAALVSETGLLLPDGFRHYKDPFLVNQRGERMTERVLQLNLRNACLRAGEKPFTLTSLRNLAITSMLQGGATADILSYQLGITDNWFFRLDHAVRDLPKAAANYSHLKVIW